jgi:CBS domain containing-hemolysin-like protein
MLPFILYLSSALILSFLCSMLEASLLSTTHSFIGSKINEGKFYGKIFKKFKENIDLPLSAILTLNTAANTLGAAGVGAEAQKLWGNEIVSLVSILLTLAILFFSEIIPKTIGANYWRNLAAFTAVTLTILIYSPLYPFIFIGQKVTSLINRNKKSTLFSRAEFLAMVERSVSQGLFKEEESKILLNLIRFNKVEVKNIMTPRTMVIATNENVTIKKFYDSMNEIPVSRIPIYNEKIDTITGFVLKDDIMESLINNEGENILKTLRRDILFVNEQMPIIKFFSKLIDDKKHIAVVLGEYGETVGIATMEDVIETLLGTEIVDETDNITDLQLQARKNWEQRIKKLGLNTDTTNKD